MFFTAKAILRWKKLGINRLSEDPITVELDGNVAFVSVVLKSPMTLFIKRFNRLFFVSLLFDEAKLLIHLAISLKEDVESSSCFFLSTQEDDFFPEPGFT